MRKAMIEQERSDRNRNGYNYVRSLLQDKKRELRSLDLRFSWKLIPSEDYHSCRRSLSQAINQLMTLLSDDTGSRNSDSDDYDRTKLS